MGDTKQRTGLARAFTLGIVAGLRSQMPLAVLGWKLRKLPGDGHPENRASVLQSPWLAPVATTLAAGELVGDKLPMTPSRLNPAPLIGRLVLGGLAGAIVALMTQENPRLGSLAGACGAMVGAFGGYHARKAIGEATGIPGPIVAVGEDAIAIGLGVEAVRSLPTRWGQSQTSSGTRRTGDRVNEVWRSGLYSGFSVRTAGFEPAQGCPLSGS